jgi:hypothetical protein
MCRQSATRFCCHRYISNCYYHVDMLCSRCTVGPLCVGKLLPGFVAIGLSGTAVIMLICFAAEVVKTEAVVPVGPLFVGKGLPGLVVQNISTTLKKLLAKTRLSLYFMPGSFI